MFWDDHDVAPLLGDTYMPPSDPAHTSAVFGLNARVWISACTKGLPPPPVQWALNVQLDPPLEDRQMLTPPTNTTFLSTGEAAMAKSYQPWPPVPVPFTPQSSKLGLVGPFTCVHEAPRSVDR